MQAASREDAMSCDEGTWVPDDMKQSPSLTLDCALKRPKGSSVA